MSGNFIIDVNDEPAFVYTGGRPFDLSRPAIVFIHGAAMDHSVWVLPARYFARHAYNVIAVDLPGHGRSGGTPLDSIEAMADFIAALLDALHIDKASLVGHSMGSLVAFDVARRHATRVSALALVGSALPMAVSDPLLNASQQDSHDAIDMLTYWGYSRAAQLGGSETPGMWMAGGTLRLLERAAPGVLHTDLSACNRYRINAEQESPIDVPALMILGDKDMMTPPRNSGLLKSLLTNVRIEILKGSGHTLMAERADKMLDALITIL
ncbi:MAG: alpha/beta hydrolase [marine bacterium B5-7]|nr:MAG: alpha/beta hydrolase [marine bacterium B5-7]